MDFDSLLAKIKREKKPFFTDLDFDQYLPPRLQKLSSSQWTPLFVIKEIVQMIKTHSISHIYDLGSGVGKFSILVSLLGEIQVTGFEQRKELLDLAQALKIKFKANLVEFSHLDFLELDFSHFDAIYCFNPLYETMSTKFSIDEETPKSSILYIQKILKLKSNFLNMQKGSKIITYHGFGGIMPKEFKLITKRKNYFGEIEVWEKN